MAQRRYWNLEDDDTTFDLNVRLIGILSPGIYRGFDFLPAASMDLSLGHTLTGYRYPKRDQSGLTNWSGVLSTNQGVIIVEDEIISLPIDPNPAATARRDAIVITHKYAEIVGGEQATYSVRKGAPAATVDDDPQAPGVLNPDTDLLVGTLLLPAGTVALNAPGVTWTRSATPFLAGDDSKLPYVFSRNDNVGVVKTVNNGRAGYDVFLHSTPIFKTDAFTPNANDYKETGFYSLQNATNVPTGDGWHYVQVHTHSDGSGNEYVNQIAYTLTNNPGSAWRRACIAGNWTTWRRLDAFQSGGADDANFNNYTESGAYRLGGTPSNGPAGVGSNLWTLLVTGVFDLVHQIATEQNSLTANVWSRTYSAYLNQGSGGWTGWRRMDTVDLEGRVQVTEASIVALVQALAGKEDNVPIGVIWEWAGSVAAFDNTGKGLSGSRLEKWALCNGQNGTQDRRGRFVVGYDPGTDAEVDDSSYSHQPPTGGYYTYIDGYFNYGKIGNKGGKQTVGLTTSQNAPHTHTSDAMKKTQAITFDGGSSGGSAADWMAGVNAATINSSGSGSPHENRPPYVVTGFIQKIG